MFIGELGKTQHQKKSDKAAVPTSLQIYKYFLTYVSDDAHCPIF